MARDVFDVELGYAISAENGDRQVLIISGTAVPDGTSGQQSAAPIGSLYIRSGTGELYQKIANAGAPADYELNGAATPASLGNWRPERVDFHTGDVITAGSVDITALTDNDDGYDGTNAVVGHYILDGNCALWEITAFTSATDITVAAAGTPPATDDMFAVRYNLPDPAGQENQAIITYDGTNCIKVADADWGVANAIGLATYTAGSGDVTSADTVQSALQKIDGNNDAQDSVLGTAQGATNLGTFTGSTISDNGSVKAGMQELETAHEEVDQNVNDLITLSGVAENSTDLGTFTGDIISDNTTVKNALQEVETELVDTRDNADDLITLSGVAENSTNFGAFASPGDFLLTATETMKSALQKLADYLFGVKVTQTTGVTTAVAVDSLAHATYRRVVWHVEVFVTATPANREGFTIEALTDGTSVDDTKYAKLKLGSSIAGLTSAVAINGANLELQIGATPSCTVNVRRITVV